MCSSIPQKLYAGLSSTKKIASSLHFSQTFHSVRAALCSPLYFLLSHSLWHIWQELLSLSPSSTLRLQWFSGHLFFPKNGTADELAGRGALLQPSTVPRSHFPLTSRIYFSRYGCVLSHLNSSTHRLPQCLLKNLFSLVTFAVSSFASLKWTLPSFKL